MRNRLLPLLAAAALGIAGCGADATTPADPTSPPPPAAPAAPPATPGEPGEPAGGEVPESLAFTATTVGGEPFEGAALAGEPAVLWFWAPWCPRCIAQSPRMLELANDVTVVGVAGLAPAEDMQEFIDLTRTESLTHLSDPDSVLWDKFGVGTTQETLVVIDADGEVVLSGIVTTDEVRASLGLS